jgi:hypothetical protein
VRIAARPLYACARLIPAAHHLPTRTARGSSNEQRAHDERLLDRSLGAVIGLLGDAVFVRLARPNRRVLSPCRVTLSAVPRCLLAAALVAAGCGARTELSDTSDVSDAGPVDGAHDASAQDAGDGAPSDAAFECPASEPVIGSSCPLAGYQCLYFPPGDQQGGVIDVFYCQSSEWSTSTSTVTVPACADVACIPVPSQCIMGSCQRCTCGADGLYDDCGPC